MNKSPLRLITPWRAIAATMLIIGVYVLFLRYSRGLGAVTNLTDETPWGIWISFDILVGVGLAAGGFVMASLVYVFQMHQFKPLVRMSILTAMLGYLVFVLGLLIEIGRPWNMWRVMTNSNIHSPLFEIAICVMTYTTVLILEFSLVVFERLGLKKLVALHHKVSVPLVILGVMLSTLHQSTLGTLFTIMPSRMHALWYSPLLPVHFYLSCIAAGVGMVCFEAFLGARFLKHEPPLHLMRKLAKGMAVVLVLYFIYRIVEMAVLGVIGQAFEMGGLPAQLFWLENLCFVIIPVSLIIAGRNNLTERGLFFVSFSVVLGFVMHRFNVAVSSMELVNPTGYFPSATEMLVTACLVAGGMIAAGLAVFLFPIHEHVPAPVSSVKGQSA